MEKLIRATLEEHGWFITSKEMPWILQNFPMLPVLVRRGAGRNVMTAVDAAKFIKDLEAAYDKPGDDYLRDISTWPDDFDGYPTNNMPHTKVVGWKN